MKKLLLYATVALGYVNYSLLISGAGDESVLRHLNSITSNYETQWKACQAIGRERGRFLSLLESGNKKKVFEKCEFELLGLRRDENNRSLSYMDELARNTVHPRAWFAVAEGQLPQFKGWAYDTAALQRFDKLKKVASSR